MFGSEGEEVGVKYYRYQLVQWAAPVDEFDRPYGEGRVTVELYEYDVVKETLKGVWIQLLSPWKRFVRTVDVRKQYAWPTKELAMESFRARTKAHIRILKARLRVQERGLLIAENQTERILQDIC